MMPGLGSPGAGSCKNCIELDRRAEVPYVSRVVGRDSRGNACAPKEQPPRKLSGKRTATLQKSGKWHDGVPADGIILSGNTTDGAFEFGFQELKETPTVNVHSVVRQPTAPDSDLSQSSLSHSPDNTPAGLCDLFKIGIGPSSSHTIGPMKAAGFFLRNLAQQVDRTHRVVATAYGSLAWTGKGHATDKALILGLAGERPEEIDPDAVEQKLRDILDSGELRLPGSRVIHFDPQSDVVFDTHGSFERHPNAMTFEAFDASGRRLLRELWFSVGGGFVEQDGAANPTGESRSVPYLYKNASTLLALGRSSGLSIAAMVLANEATQRSESDTAAAIDKIASVMLACIDRGLSQEGPLPGGLKVKRRAKGLYQKAEATRVAGDRAGSHAMNYVSAFAIAVNEENACGGRVVTAPTNGAAGVVPAVLRYYRDFCSGSNRQGVHDYFLAATAIGGIIRRNASISGAEMGCQGEVGSAAAMAAAGLTAALGGSNTQIENAAEIALEHHLGMTCDPIGGLVQIPCIERNAFGAIKAINAASLALDGDGTHRVSLDQAIETMRQTGRDMHWKYRETSRGGLALNVPEC
jgi:L-serine dehydratase